MASEEEDLARGREMGGGGGEVELRDPLSVRTALSQNEGRPHT